jgi:hypothetical protein
MKGSFSLIILAFLLQSCTNLRLNNQTVSDDVYYQPNFSVVVDEYYNYDLVENRRFTNFGDSHYNRSRFGFEVYPSWNWRPYSGFWIYEPFYFNQINSWQYNWWYFNYWNGWYAWRYSCWREYERYPYINHWSLYSNPHKRVHYGRRPSSNLNSIQSPRSLEISTPSRKESIKPRSNKIYSRPTTTTRTQYKPAPISISPQPKHKPAISSPRPSTRSTSPTRSAPSRSTPIAPRLSK